MKNSFDRFVAPAIVLAMMLLSFSSYSEAQTHGRWINTKISEDSLVMMSLNFVDTNVGYLMASRKNYYRDRNYLLTPYNRFFYFRTIDGGANWTPFSFGKYSMPGDTVGINNWGYYSDLFGYGIVPATPTIAYTLAVMIDSVNPNLPPHNFLLKTTNMGTTWVQVNTVSEATVKSLGNIRFFSENVGVSTNLQHTIDGGQHWFVNRWTNYPNIEYTIDGMHYKTAPAAYPIAFLDNSHFLSINTHRGFGFGSTLGYGTNPASQPKNGITTYLSTDGGFIWNASNWDDSLRPFATHYDSTNDGTWIMETAKNSSAVFLFYDLVGFAYDSIVPFYKSLDYGKTWSQNHSFDGQRRGFASTTPDDLWMIVFPKRVPYYYTHAPWAPDWVDTTSQGYKDSIAYWSSWIGVKNRLASLKASWIVHSADGGKKWDIDSFSLRDPELGEYDGRFIRSTDPRHLWIGAMKNGFSYVFRYKAPGVNAVEEGRDIPPPDYPNFINIYPNPANDKVKIALWRNAGIKQIRIFDILGREIKAPTKQLTQSSFELDVSLVAAGPYILVCDIAGGSNLARTLMVRK